MAQQLTAEKREELFQQWSKVQSIAHTARTCEVHHNTAAKYFRLDGWETRLAKVTTRAAVKADTKQVNERARWAKMGQMLQKVGFEYMFDKKTGEVNKAALEMMEPKDAIKALKAGVEIERMALGDTAGIEDKPLVIVVQDRHGTVRTLSAVPLVTDADFEDGDNE